MTKFVIPGPFWLALIAFITVWLPDLAPGAPWLPSALLVLTAIAKAVQVLVTPPPELDHANTANRSYYPAPPPPSPTDKVVRWLVG